MKQYRFQNRRCLKCQVEMGQGHSDRVQEQVEVWVEVAAEAEGEEIGQEQGLVEVVSAQAVGRR